MVSPEKQTITSEITPPEIQSEESNVSLSGLMNRLRDWRINRLTGQADQLSEDAALYRDIPEASLAVITPKAPYDPLASFDSVHRSRRAGFGERVRPVAENLQARTELQGKSAVRATLRVDSLKTQRHTIDQYDSLHPEFGLRKKTEDIVSRKGSGFFIPWGDRRILKKQLEDELSRVKHTKSDAKSVQGAGKQVLKSHRKIRRVEDRLSRSMAGSDIPGRIVTTQLRHLNEEIDRLRK